jgi:endonuclease/exonuclease/phosphatase family metal-dependent hydrolase
MARRVRSYYDDISRGKSRSGDGIRRFSVIDAIMLIVSAAIAIAIVLAWAARWINPASYGILSSAGLLMPALFACNFLSLLYWTIRWRRGAFIPLTVFVVGIWSLTLFFRPQITKDYADFSHDRSLVNVVSYNVQGMMQENSWGSGLRSNMDEVISVIDSLRPDILCMQEFQTTPKNPRSRFDEALPLLNYKRVRYNIAGSEEGFGWGNAIYSKYPITGSGHIDFEGTNNAVIWADVIIVRDTVRVFNAHLQTTAIKVEDERYIVGGDFVGDSTRRSQMRHIADKLAGGNVIRAIQADTLAARIASSPYPVIVCGDFNDTPVSYAYRKISRRLDDSFREAGRGYGYTYRGFFDMLRIDYVLHSRSMECVWYSSPSFDTSDHNPVAVKIKIK